MEDNDAQRGAIEGGRAGCISVEGTTRMWSFSLLIDLSFDRRLEQSRTYHPLDILERSHCIGFRRNGE